MTQASVIIPNSTGFDFRQNINAALMALITNSGADTEPVVTYPGMFWVNYSVPGGQLLIRDLTNAHWNNVIGADQVARDAAAAANANAELRVYRTGDTMTGRLAFADTAGIDFLLSYNAAHAVHFRHDSVNFGNWLPARNAGAGDWAWRFYDDGGTPRFHVNANLITGGAFSGLSFVDRNAGTPYQYQLYGNGGKIFFRADSRDILSVEAATGLVTFQRRPIFGTATPWDSLNYVPPVLPNDATLFWNGVGGWTKPLTLNFPGGTTSFLRADGQWAVPPGTGGGGGAGGVWGAITGDITTQTDLMAMFATYSLDANVVHRTGNEIVSGFKAFQDTVGSQNQNFWWNVNGRRGLIFHDDGMVYSILRTALDDQMGAWDTSRPFTLDYENILVSLANGNYTFGLAMATFYQPVVSQANITFGTGYLLGSTSLGVKHDLVASGVYTIGIQQNRVYFRAAMGWNFFAGGTHSDTTDDPGPGGALVAQIDALGNIRARDLFAKRTDGGGAVFFGDQATGAKYLYYDATQNGYTLSGGLQLAVLSNVKANAFIAVNPGQPTIGGYYFGNQSGGDRSLSYDGSRYIFSGGINVEATQYRATQNFISGTVNVVLASIEGQAGAVYLRPNGYNNAAGEARLGSDGNFTIAGSLWVGGGTIQSSGPNLLLGASGGSAGALYLRPQGASVSTNQTYIQIDGQSFFGGTINTPAVIIGGIAWVNQNIQLLNATRDAYVIQPRLHVTATDPGAGAFEGDLWIW